MTCEIERVDGGRTGRTGAGNVGGRGRPLAAGSAALALAVSASFALARIQDPADAPSRDEPAAKTKAAAKQADVPEPPAPDGDAATKVEPPPPPGFSHHPRTASELVEVFDYLVRARQAPQAVPYVRQFLSLEPDDATWLALRDQFGEGAFLRLADHEATRPYLKPIYDRLAAAIVRRVNDPDRIKLHVSALAKSPAERDLAVSELRPAGGNAVGPILEAYRAATGEERTLIGRALGGLDRNAGPALLAALDGEDEAETSLAAESLARIGDVRATPQLTYLAARPRGPGKAAAAKAVETLTGLSFSAQPNSPTKVLSDEARRDHLRTADLPPYPAIWVWDSAAKLPTPKLMDRADALGHFGVKYAREALELDPSNLDAQVAFLALSLDRTPAGTIPDAALKAGPDVLGRVLTQAIADRRPEVAERAIAALAKVTGRDALGSSGRPGPLVDALGAPDRRVQFAAAEALVDLEPKAAFPGSSRLIPILARFAANPRRHGVVVIDGNPNRGSQVVGHLAPLGYNVQFAQTGEDGFRLAAGAANVEMVVLNPAYLSGAWTTHDTLANLRADARTAGLPIFLVGPLDLEGRFQAKYGTFPGLRFLVFPTESNLLKTQIDRALNAHGVAPLTEAERSAYALKACQLLTRVARQKGGPFANDLASVEPNLVLALNHSATTETAALALGDIPGHDAQRSLADMLLDPSKPAPARLKAGGALAHHLRRFGPLLSAGQEVKLSHALEVETDPAIRTALATVVGALKPKPAQVGRMLRDDRPSTVVTK